MFDVNLENPMGNTLIIPLNPQGAEDWDIHNYRIFYAGARAPVAYHQFKGMLEPCPVGSLIQVLENDLLDRGERIPKSTQALFESFSEIRIDGINDNSEHLLCLRDGKILNVAAFANEIEESGDHRENLLRWIQPSHAYVHHNLTYKAGATYIQEKKRVSENPIKKYIDDAVRDPETANVLHFAFATPMIGIQSIKAIFTIIGPKNAGKSLTYNLIGAMYGSYTMTVPPIDFLPYNEQRLVRELFANHGKRFLRIDELNKEAYFNEPLIKRITGRDGLSNPFVTSFIREFYPQVKLFCDSNAPLKAQVGKESSISDRLFYIPYGRVVPRESRDPYFEAKLCTQDNLDTYFSWLVDTYLMAAIKGILP